MGTTKRTYYYYKSGRAVARAVFRRSGFGRWPKSQPDEHALQIGYIEDPSLPMTIVEGPAATADRVAEMVRMHKGVFSTTSEDIGAAIPNHVLQRVAEQVDRAARRVTSRFGRYANEDRACGDFFASIESEIHEGGWRITITSQGFSTHLKGPTTGADEAILIDIVNATGQRLVKTLWLQAKIAGKAPSTAGGHARLDGQLEAMQRRTREAYAIIFSPDGTRVFGPGGEDGITPSQMMVEGLRCQRGDRNALAVAEALDRDLVLELLVLETK